MKPFLVGRVALRLAQTLWTVVVCGLITACGYQFVTGGPGPVIGDSAQAERMKALRAKAPTLEVLAIRNNSFQPNLEFLYRDYLRREFAAGSGARVVPKGQTGDLQLSGVIENVIVPTLSFSKRQTFESRVIVTMSVAVRDQRSSQVVWKQRATASSEFFITDDLQQNRTLQDRAVEQAGQYLAADLATQFLDYLEATLRSRADAGAGASTTARTPAMSSLHPAQELNRETRN